MFFFPRCKSLNKNDAYAYVKNMWFSVPRHPRDDLHRLRVPDDFLEGVGIFLGIVLRGRILEIRLLGGVDQSASGLLYDRVVDDRPRNDGERIHRDGQIQDWRRSVGDFAPFGNSIRCL